MARELNKLAPGDIMRLQPGLHNDGEGLYVRVKENGSRYWVFRYRARGRNSLRDMGLGPCSTLTLKQARAEARKRRVELLNGSDPIDSRRASRTAATGDVKRRTPFMECAVAYIASHNNLWRNDKHRKQWLHSLQDYCGEWGNLPVGRIDTDMVLKALEPRWTTHTETASRVRQRIERILDWAKVKDLREGENPARWRGHLDKALPAPTKIKEVTHRAALPYGELPAFMASLTPVETLAAKALTLQVLTAARPGEAVGARWEEFDLNKKTWTIPKVRMKSKQTHVVPLSLEVMALLNSLPRLDGDPRLFPGVKDRSLTTAATMKLLKTLNADITCHGFRSTFRDWAAEQTNYAGAVAEFALAHGVKDQTVAAYFRTTLFDKRKELMSDWAEYCMSARKTARASEPRGSKKTPAKVTKSRARTTA